MDRLLLPGTWPCLPRDLEARLEAVRCFGRHESERAAVVILKVLQTINQWVPVRLHDLTQVSRGDESALSGIGYLQEGEFIVETSDGYMVSGEFVDRIFRYRLRI